MFVTYRVVQEANTKPVPHTVVLTRNLPHFAFTCAHPVQFVTSENTLCPGICFVYHQQFPSKTSLAMNIKYVNICIAIVHRRPNYQGSQMFLQTWHGFADICLKGAEQVWHLLEIQVSLCSIKIHSWKASATYKHCKQCHYNFTLIIIF